MIENEAEAAAPAAAAAAAAASAAAKSRRSEEPTAKSKPKTTRPRPKQTWLEPFDGQFGLVRSEQKAVGDLRARRLQLKSCRRTIRCGNVLHDQLELHACVCVRECVAKCVRRYLLVLSMQTSSSAQINSKL